MTRTRVAVLALILLPVGLPARADKHGGPGGTARISAADFLDLCQASAPGPRRACSGLLVNFMEVHVLLGSKDKSMRVICPPRRLPNDQALFMFNGWAAKQPNLDKLEVSAAIGQALRETFPCRDAPEVEK